MTRAQKKENRSHIRLPNVVAVHTLRNFLSKCEFFPVQPTAFSLHFHPRFNYLPPFALAMLAAWARYWAQKRVPIECKNLEANGVAYAARMGLLGILGVEVSEFETHEEAGRFIPLRAIHSSTELQGFIADVAPLLHEPEHIRPVLYCVSEITRNVLEHAGGVPAFACAQYYPKARRVSIGVADCGCGISKALSQSYTFQSDAQYIVEAMKPGVTGTASNIYGSSDNAGAGLFFTKSIAQCSGEYFALISGGAAYRLRKGQGGRDSQLHRNPLKNKHDLYAELPPWQGTAVAIDIGVGGKLDFADTLKIIRRAYSDRSSETIQSKVKFT